jgi:replicative DNA helicase
MTTKIQKLIVDKTLYTPDSVSLVAECEESYFTHPVARDIHSAIKCLYEQSKPVNRTTVEGQLSAMGKNPEVVTALYLEVGTITDYTPVSVLIDQLKEATTRSELKDLGKYLMTASDPLEHMIERADIGISKLSAPVQTIDISKEVSLHDARPETKYYSGVDISGTKFNLWETELTIIAARPALGKTSVACHIAANVMDLYKVPVFHFSLEVSKRHIYYRNLTRITGVDFNRIRDRTMTPSEDRLVCEAFDQMRERWAGLYYVDDQTSHVDGVVLKVKELAKKRKPGLVLLDYVQLYDGNGDTVAGRVGDVSRSMKRLAQRMGIPVMLVAMLNRTVESRSNKEPILSDLKDSGSLEQDANNVVFLWEDDEGSSWLTKAKMRSEAAGKGIILLDKGRYKVSNKYIGQGSVRASDYRIDQ